MQKKIFNLFFVTLLLLSFSPLSCKKDREINTQFLNDLDVDANLNWAVVISPYASFRADAGFENKVTSYARLNDLFQVKGKKTVVQILDENSEEKVKVTWYKLDSGWIDESCVNIFDSKLKAQKSISQNLTDSKKQ